MNIFVKALAAAASVAVLAGCEYGILDNYDEPDAVLTGQVVYEEMPIGVRSNGVQLELWQPEYPLREKIPVYVNQDGSFSAAVFDGEYELTLIPGNGPWVHNPDTIDIELRRRAEVSVPVVPYYTIRDETVEHSSGNVEATFSIVEVDTSQPLEYVGLYVSTTSFIDRSNMEVRTELARSEIASLDGPVQLSVALPPRLAEREDVFVRVGVKTVGVAEMLFSPVHKLSL